MADGLNVVDEQVPAMEDNVEQTAAWDGPLFEVWLRYRDLIEHSRTPLEVGLAIEAYRERTEVRPRRAIPH